MENLIIPKAEPFLHLSGKTGCVLVHGFTGSPKEMKMMGDYLFKNGISVLGIRIAGHATQVSDMIRTRWNDWLASVEDGINLLSGICDDIFVCGLSMGGVLALICASIYQINGVVVMAAPYRMPNDWRVRFAKPLSAIKPSFTKKKKRNNKDSSQEDHISYAEYPARSISELKLLIDIGHQNITKINVPVLMINAINDKMVPLPHAEEYQRRIPSHLFQLMILENSGHVITEDEEREVAFKAALDFIHTHRSK
jgi:carboxylesterase